jgi:hypothetical protein
LSFIRGNHYATKTKTETTGEIEEKERVAAEKRAETEWPRFWNGGNYSNFEHIRNNLAALQREMDAAVVRLPALIREHTRLLKAGENDALQQWRNGAGLEVTQLHRENQRMAYVEAQGFLEDLLYFQNIANRMQRLRLLESDKDKKVTLTNDTRAVEKRTS